MECLMELLESDSRAKLQNPTLGWKAKAGQEQEMGQDQETANQCQVQMERQVDRQVMG